VFTLIDQWSRKVLVALTCHVVSSWTRRTFPVAVVKHSRTRAPLTCLGTLDPPDRRGFLPGRRDTVIVVGSFGKKQHFGCSGPPGAWDPGPGSNAARSHWIRRPWSRHTTIRLPLQLLVCDSVRLCHELSKISICLVLVNRIWVLATTYDRSIAA